eukprot:4921559-Pyramimonas_sp.AAC.1
MQDAGVPSSGEARGHAARCFSPQASGRWRSCGRRALGCPFEKGRFSTCKRGASQAALTSEVLEGEVK